MQGRISHVALVEELWSPLVSFVGQEAYRSIVADPKAAVESLRGDMSQRDEALRFDLKTAVEILVGALSLSKTSMEVWRAAVLAKRALAIRELDALIRERVKNSPLESSLLESDEYKLLLKKLAE